MDPDDTQDRSAFSWFSDWLLGSQKWRHSTGRCQQCRHWPRWQFRGRNRCRCTGDSSAPARSGHCVSSDDGDTEISSAGNYTIIDTENDNNNRRPAAGKRTQIKTGTIGTSTGTSSRALCSTWIAIRRSIWTGTWAGAATIRRCRKESDPSFRIWFRTHSSRTGASAGTRSEN